MKDIRMKPIRIFLIVGLFVLFVTKGIHAQQTMKSGSSLDDKQQSIITISALTAKGDLEQLQIAIHNGLDDSLTVNQIKEMLVHVIQHSLCVLFV